MQGILNGLDYEKSLHACVTTPFFRTRKKHGSIFVSWSFLQTLSSFIRSTAFFFLLGTSPHFERPFLFPKKLPKDRRQPVQKDLVPESISMCAGLFFATAQPDQDSGGGGVGGLVYIMEDVLLGLCLSSRWNEEIGNDSRSVM